MTSRPHTLFSTNQTSPVPFPLEHLSPSLPYLHPLPRWLKKHGRKWPDNGLNTEDLVWLYEEAYKDEAADQEAAAAAAAGDGAASSSAASSGRPRGKNTAGGRLPKPPRVVNREREDIPGELMESSEEALEAAVAGLPKDAKARAAAVARAKREVENATWVTDEFESSDYERGNLEAVHDMYLWDREGKTTIMPDGEGVGAWGGGSYMHGWYRQANLNA